jgi:hypothetical protein
MLHVVPSAHSMEVTHVEGLSLRGKEHPPATIPAMASAKIGTKVGTGIRARPTPPAPKSGAEPPASACLWARAGETIGQAAILIAPE